MFSFLQATKQTPDSGEYFFFLGKLYWDMGSETRKDRSKTHTHLLKVGMITLDGELKGETALDGTMRVLLSSLNCMASRFMLKGFQIIPVLWQSCTMFKFALHLSISGSKVRSTSRLCISLSWPLLPGGGK